MKLPKETDYSTVSSAGVVTNSPNQNPGQATACTQDKGTNPVKLKRVSKICFLCLAAHWFSVWNEKAGLERAIDNIDFTRNIQPFSELFPNSLINWSEFQLLSFSP